MEAKTAARLESHGTSDARGLVCEYVAEGVLSNDDVEETWLCEYAHGGIVYEHIVGGDVRILGLHLLGYLSPQA